MAWWQKFTVRSRKIASSRSWPISFEPLPGKLSARVHLHDMDCREGTISCWTYVTNGLRACGQKELIFSLRRNPEEQADSFPHAPLAFFTDVYGFAQQGRLVDVGDISEMAAPTFMGHKGLLYIEPESSQNVERLDAALAAILLTEGELEAVKAFGATRAMARLGDAHRYYPCPPWSDRRRPGISFASSLRESILMKVPTLRMRGIRVRSEANHIVLRLLPQVRDHLLGQIEQIGSHTPLALLTDLDPAAHGCLVWQPGQSRPAAITPPDSDGTRLCGCFALFASEQPNDSGKLFEDGYAMMLTSASWSAIRQALAAGDGISIPASDTGMGFRLEWIETSYHNPVEQRTYSADGGWDTHVAAVSRDRRDEAPGSITLRQVVLLSSQQDLGTRVEINALGAYIQAIDETVRSHFARVAPANGQDLVVQFDLAPDGKVDVGIALRPGISGETLRDLHSSLLTRAVPEVRDGSIKFHVIFDIWGGSKCEDAASRRDASS